MPLLLRLNPSIFSAHQALPPRLAYPKNQIQKPSVRAPYHVLCLSYSSSASDNPDSILSLLSSYGFSEAQINGVVQKKPFIAAANPEKIIKPKLDCFLAFGYSPAELISLVCSNPGILGSSLDDRIACNLNLLESLLGSKELVKKAINHNHQLLRVSLEETLMLNMNTLREYGVPPENIRLAVSRYSRALTMKNDAFTKTVKKVRELGIEPSLTSFIIGINVMLWQSPAIWKRKLELYQSFGWSEKDTLLAFAKYPFCLANSEEKIKKMMEFFVEKLRVDSSYLALHPVLFTYSLEQRIIPRSAVVGVLVSKGLLDYIPAWTSLFIIPEKKFKEKFIDRYRKEVPQVLDAFQGKLEFTGFDLMERREEIRNQQ